MLMELCFCLFVSAVLFLVLFLLHLDSAEDDQVTKTRWSRIQQLWDKGTFKNKPLKVSKDVIIAMTERGIYSLNPDVVTDDDGGEVRQWTNEMLEKSLSKLEQSQPNISLYKKIANDFLEKLEKSVEESKDNLCELNNNLEQITEMHRFIKEEIRKELCNEKQRIAGNIVPVSDNCNRFWVPPVPSFRCAIIVDGSADDNFQTILLDQLEEARGIPQ